MEDELALSADAPAAGPAPQVECCPQVFVMSEDDAIRRNRMSVMSQLSELPAGILSFQELPGF